MGAIKIKGATSGSTTITAPATGSDESIELSTALASKLDLAGGKILQIVRATDATVRTTTSTSAVDASISVTITPQKSDSALIVINSFETRPFSNSNDNIRGNFQITDSSNNALSGAERMLYGTSGLTGSGDRTVNGPIVLIGYVTPATTSAVTYKLRFWSQNAATSVGINDGSTGQMYAIEVSA